MGTLPDSGTDRAGHSPQLILSYQPLLHMCCSPYYPAFSI